MKIALAVFSVFLSNSVQSLPNLFWEVCMIRERCLPGFPMNEPPAGSPQKGGVTPHRPKESRSKTCATTLL